MKLLVVLVVVVAICHADSVRSRDELDDEEEMLPRAAQPARRRGSFSGSYDHNSRTGRLGYTHNFRNGASLTGYGSFHPGGHGFGASFSSPISWGKRAVAYVDLPDEVEDEEEMLQGRELARRQGKVTGSYDSGSKSGSLDYQHTFNNGRTRLGGSVHFARGQQPGYGVSGSHTFRNGVTVSGGGRFHPSGNSYGAQVSIPFGWGKRATTSVDLPEDLEDEEQLFLRAAPLARRGGKVTGSYDQNSRTGRLGYTHTFRNGATLSGYGSFHPGGHGYGAQFSLPISWGKRAIAHVDLPDELNDEEETLQRRNTHTTQLAGRGGKVTGSYDQNSRTGRLGYTHTFRNGATLSGYGSFHPGGHGYGAQFSVPIRWGKRAVA